ncbi:MAG: hypothetical protein EPO21_06595 [Chloroflexota bacterium]|nr:MAG: hypothetical protein EPO21_06595 [Chloroflexota bacterium]
MDRIAGKIPAGRGRRRSGMAGLLAAGALLLILLVGCSASSSQPPSSTVGASASPAAAEIKMSPNVPEITRAQAPGPYQGGARLAIDEASFDYGKVKLGEWLEAVFHVKNVGDAPLTITGEPLVRAVEGC